MDFFQHQENARIATRQLVLLFILAVVAIAAAVSLTTALVFGIAGLPRPQHLWLTNTLLTALFIGGGSLVEISRLRAGGEVVAQQVGGRAIASSTRDPLERRLLNVVEEMALAAGVPVPRVYVLDREDGINAFAAGWSVNNAVLAVTRGTLARLNRQELQGVVAHEFSHILNGDMRLNLRLMGVLYGLLMLSMFGRFLMEADARSPAMGGRKTLSFFAVIGLGVWLVGGIGVFFGRWIKAAVSRRREFLADASAVQFTRDTGGLGGALRKIGGLAREFGAHGDLARGDPGSLIRHRQAESLSHLFLGPASKTLANGFLATHPPLEERIARLYGRPMPWLAAPVMTIDPAPPAPIQPPLEFSAPPWPAALSPIADLAARHAPASASATAVALAVGRVAAPDHPDFSLDANQQAWFDQLRRQAQDGGTARLMLLAMVIDRHASPTPPQLERVTQALGAPAAAQLQALHAAI
ncbi:MAG: M48 family metallopeptidase, partial [Burkholderiaceae bacterium]